MALIWLCFVSFLISIISSVITAYPCNQTSQCESALWKGSLCVNGTCSNPYQSGCLVNRMPGWTKKRVCNSEDSPDAATRGICRDPRDGLDYMEIRIAGENWESVFFEAWIMQILLSEILDVPTSIETVLPKLGLNLYDPNNRMDYGSSSVWKGLETANKLGDCRQVAARNAKAQTVDEYTACIHVVPEVWNGDFNRLERMALDGSIEPSSFIGAIGAKGWFIPRATAKRDPSLLSYNGLAGEKNREKLANLFLRPTTWGDYCAEVSKDNCTTADAVASRAPSKSSENGRMFVAGVYTGYFRKTDENNCTMWPENCTGHFADFPCGWTSYFLPQTHYLDIALASSGKKQKSSGYTYGQLTEIWSAANATRSNVIMQWWTPEALHSTFLGTDYEFAMVNLPTTTHQCLEARIESEVRCNGSSLAAQLGSPKGACADYPFNIAKVLTSSFGRINNDPSIPAAERSPAYEAVKNFHISEFQLGKIFEYWLARNVDQYGFDAREATCRWVVENFDMLQTFIPPTFPRVVQDSSERNYGSLFFFAFVLGLIATFLAGLSCVLTYVHRNKKALKTAQLEFVSLLLLGLLLVSGASVLQSLRPTTRRCITVTFMVNLGFTLELAPLIVKVAAINRLMQAAKRMRRIQLQRKGLFGAVGVLFGVVVVFLVLWISLDPPRKAAAYSLGNEVNSQGETIVQSTYYCKSKSPAWNYAMVATLVILLVCASALAFQTRKLRNDVNETQTLAVLVYSHFMFVTLRFAVLLLRKSLDVVVASHLLSLTYSLDCIATIGIYFAPKFFHEQLSATSETDASAALGNSYGSRESMEHRSRSSISSPMFRTDPAVKIPLDSMDSSDEGCSIDNVATKDQGLRCRNCGFRNYIDR